ncbi:hypothetical protein CVT24_011015 [Panaeolus cyanescens]|uniref:Protein kinase domain-containing protein n=1 Tax=Panaeolus cyanescens TaxID=181874 RepID=A0A409YVG0_9AGAR|nr:hypothetical protein CVT24_011015 [Panaeolus cyanescens]
MSADDPRLSRECNRDVVQFYIKASKLHMEGFHGLDRDYDPVPHPPLCFTDRHICSELALRRVVYVPKLASTMADDFANDLLHFLANHDEFPVADQLTSLDGHRPFKVYNASCFEYAYFRQIGVHAICLASSIHIHPNQQLWRPTFWMKQCQRNPTFLNQVDVRVGMDKAKDYDFEYSDEAHKKIDQDILQKLRVLRDGPDCLATFHFLPACPSAQSIVRRAISSDVTHRPIPSTVAPRLLQPRKIARPVDAADTWWEAFSTQNPPVNSQANNIQRDPRRQAKGKVKIPPRYDPSDRETPDVSEYIQRQAWSRAVETDATFMVFNSGEIERIGIRHRATNTLFLSSLTKPFSGTYLTIHLALHAAIVKDALARAQSQSQRGDDGFAQPSSPGPTVKRKQQASDLDTAPRKSKRLKVQEHASIKPFDIEKEIASRHILLVSFDFGVYHSPAPSSFLRVSSSCHPDFVSKPFPHPEADKQYSLAECMHFVATEKVGSGGAGSVFRGVLQIHTDSSVIERTMVIKIPMGIQPPSAIHKEYKMYSKLAAAGVTEGIPRVHGVFEDVESDAVIMVMQDGGMDICTRQCLRDGSQCQGQVSLTQEEFDTLSRIILNINKAGITHYDIKPHNILADATGNLMIVDFHAAIPTDWNEGCPESDSPDLASLRDMFAGTFEMDKHYAHDPRASRECNRDILQFISTALPLHMKGFAGLDLDNYPDPVPHPPLWLTDRHIASELVLQRVVHVPNLMQDMVQDFNRDIRHFLVDHDEFPVEDQLTILGSFRSFDVCDASSFHHEYWRQIGIHAACFASSLHIHPNQQLWHPTFRMKQRQRYPTFLNEVDVCVEIDKKTPYDFHYRSDDIRRKIDQNILRKLRVLRDGYNCLATFHFLPPCPSAERIVLNTASGDVTVPSTLATQLLQPRNISRPVDPANAWWEAYSVQFPANSQGQDMKRGSKRQANRKVRLPPRYEPNKKETPEAAEFIQRAWARAVETDATFMVLTCGKSERIGIRHRATNTLFLSSLIAPLSGGYMIEHLALHAAIVKDALARTQCESQHEDDEITQPGSQGPVVKRKHQASDPDIEPRKSKRLKAEESLSTKSFDIEKEIACRHILLVSFDFGVYHSPAPSFFLRVSTSCHPDFISKPFQQPELDKQYPMAKCMHFIAKEKVGSGGAGSVFRGVLQIQEHSSVIERTMILKIPMGSQPPSAIHDEYKMYNILAAAGVTEGIARVYGVFEDVESNAVIMMMQDAGTDLYARQLDREGRIHKGQVSLTQDEFDALYRIIFNINKAGIEHCDIKPHNTLVDASGNLTVIDFHAATPNTWEDDPDDQNSADLASLRDMFAGTFVMDKYYMR